MVCLPVFTLVLYDLILGPLNFHRLKSLIRPIFSEGGINYFSKRAL